MSSGRSVGKSARQRSNQLQCGILVRVCPRDPNACSSLHLSGWIKTSACYQWGTSRYMTGERKRMQVLITWSSSLLAELAVLNRRGHNSAGFVTHVATTAIITTIS